MNNNVESTAVSSNTPRAQALDTQRMRNERSEVFLRLCTRADTVGTSGSPSQEGVLLELPRLGSPPKELHISFHPLQEWEGYVVAVHQDTFTARLTDLTRGADMAEEEAEFPLDDLANEDRELAQVGGVFRWAIGYHRVGGTKIRGSHLVFRRARWTQAELAAADRAGAELSAKIRWEQPSAPQT
jgi:hypothetical protein